MEWKDNSAKTKVLSTHMHTKTHASIASKASNASKAGKATNATKMLFERERMLKINAFIAQTQIHTNT